jgi:hypothetical protein
MLTITDYEVVWGEYYKHFPREFGFKKGEKFSRNLYVHDISELIEFTKQTGFCDSFVSVCTFDDEPEQGKQWNREKAIVDRIVFDLDVNVRGLIGLRIALKNVQKLVQWLIDEADTFPLLKFSGSKGFHVEVPIRPRKGSTRLLRAVGTHVAKSLNLKIVDLKVLEVARLLRLPLTIHSKTGLPCLPLDPIKILDFTVDDVIRKVKNWEYDIPYYHESDIVGVLVDFYESRQQDSFDIKILTLSRRLPATEDCFPRCMRKILSDLNAGVNVPHCARFTVASFLLSVGFSVDDIVEVFRNAPDFDLKRTRYQVEHIAGIRGGGTKYACPNCETIKSWGLCDWNCGVSHPLQFYRMCLRDKKRREKDTTNSQG